MLLFYLEGRWPAVLQHSWKGRWVISTSALSKKKGVPFEDLRYRSMWISPTPKLEIVRLWDKTLTNPSTKVGTCTILLCFGDFEHHLQMSVGDYIPILGWCWIPTFTNPCSPKHSRKFTTKKSFQWMKIWVCPFSAVVGYMPAIRRTATSCAWNKSLFW